MSVLAMLASSALRGARRTRTGWSILTPTLGPVGFYKGRGVPSTGRITRKGAFQVLDHKRPECVVPDVRGSELRPYVARGVKIAAP